jgi:hypothetical protein
VVRPGGGEFRPRRRQQQDALIADLLDRARQQLQGCRVDPVQVLKDHQDRLPTCQPSQLTEECSQGPLFPALSAHRAMDSGPRSGSIEVRQ